MSVAVVTVTCDDTRCYRCSLGCLGRWGPPGPARLQQAAFEFYNERCYDQTTVAEIAARTGLTKRAFFRHFADKREVLFEGGDRFRAALVDPVDAAPSPSATALQAVTAGGKAAGSVFSVRELVRSRQALLLVNPELQEHELIKLASLGRRDRRRRPPDRRHTLDRGRSAMVSTPARSDRTRRSQARATIHAIRWFGCTTRPGPPDDVDLPVWHRERGGQRRWRGQPPQHSRHPGQSLRPAFQFRPQPY